LSVFERKFSIVLYCIVCNVQGLKALNSYCTDGIATGRIVCSDTSGNVAYILTFSATPKSSLVVHGDRRCEPQPRRLAQCILWRHELTTETIECPSLPSVISFRSTALAKYTRLSVTTGQAYKQTTHSAATDPILKQLKNVSQLLRTA